MDANAACISTEAAKPRAIAVAAPVSGPLSGGSLPPVPLTWMPESEGDYLLQHAYNSTDYGHIIKPTATDQFTCVYGGSRVPQIVTD